MATEIKAACRLQSGDRLVMSYGTAHVGGVHAGLLHEDGAYVEFTAGYATYRLPEFVAVVVEVPES